jgi:fluoride ion exporter CrcB/FEX
MAPAFAGLIGDSRRRTVTTAINNESTAEIPYGVMVKPATDPQGCLRLTPVLLAQVINDIVFTAANATDTLTAVAHGLQTGDGPVQVANTGGGLPAGLAAATNYWVIRLTADTFKLATSFANAIAGTPINITTDGTGTQTLSDTVATKRVTLYQLSGVIGHDHAQARLLELGSIGLLPFARAGLVRRGPVWVIAENAPVKTDRVHVRVEAFNGQVPGAFRSTADAGTTIDVTDFAQWTGRNGTQQDPLTFSPSTFTADATSDNLTVVAHGLVTGDGPFQVSNTGGGLPAGLAAATNYWVIATGNDTFKLATSLANAIAGTAIDVTTAGTGTQTITSHSALRTSWIGEVDLDLVNSNLATAG